jgi:hypothetical protein
MNKIRGTQVPMGSENFKRALKKLEGSVVRASSSKASGATQRLSRRLAARHYWTPDSYRLPQHALSLAASRRKSRARFVPPFVPPFSENGKTTAAKCRVATGSSIQAKRHRLTSIDTAP